MTTEPLVFKPRSSQARLWLLGFSILLFVLIFLFTAPSILLVPFPVNLITLAIDGVIIVALDGFFIALALWLPTMRYELDETQLRLHYGPLLHYEIPLATIQSVRRRDLTFSLRSGLRLPGLAAFSVLYADVGLVQMCATSSMSGILLIESTQGRYGITPTDEPAFVAALQARLKT